MQFGTFLRSAALAAILAFASAALADLRDDRAAILATHRKLIVLLAADPTADARTESAESRVGKILFHEGHERMQRFAGSLADAIRRWNPALGPEAAVEEFLRFVESSAELRDADKLAFRDALAAIAEAMNALPGHPAARAMAARIATDLRALDEIQRLYDRELGEIHSRLGTRALERRRESWESFVAFVRGKYSKEDILREYAHALQDGDDARGTAGEQRASTRHPNENNGSGLPSKTLVLTFDDGPHALFTDRIIEILARYDAPAIFFHVGRNVGAVGPDGKPSLVGKAEVVRRVLAAGHTIANHSYSHPHLPSISPSMLAKEIDDPQVLLREISHQAAPMFRAPYGARNQRILAELGARQLKSIMWNIDSKDWADPVPASIAQRVVDGAAEQGRGIILFHDIQERTVQALPLVLEALKREGYRFAGWNGADFIVKVQNGRGGTQVVSAEPARGPVYRESYAVVVGINDYRHWPKLKHAVADATGVKELLVRKYGFKPENVFTLLDRDATRERILSLLGDKLADPKLVNREDRVLVFFAGHGATRKLASGRELGYIIPADAESRNYHGQAISMTQFQDFIEAIPAKHILFLMDSCYSGLALTRSGGAVGRSANYLREIGRRTARQMFTAGGADQEVADGGPNGHSIFTWTLLQGLEGKADANGDGVITATELASHVAPVVSSLSRQTPAFGNLVGSEGGEFVFELTGEGEFLSAQSRQLDDEAVRLNADIDRLRHEIMVKEERNRKLRDQLASVRSGLSGGAEPASEPRQERTANQLNEEGTALFRERRYAEALEKFAAAAQLDSAFALATNNLGFTYYKLERYAESLEWFERTVAIDPKRAVAYLNLGDAYLRLGRRDEARRAFERYRELLPEGRAAAYVTEQLRTLQ